MLWCVCCSYQYILGAATSPAVKVNEETLTYLNQGESNVHRFILTYLNQGESNVHRFILA